MKARWLTLLLLCLTPCVWAKSKHSLLLKNGLKVYVIEDHRAPVVHVSLWYRVGSADEAGGKTGLSHMLEHMLFRGTQTTKDGEYIEQINRLGGKMNAMTTRDFTMYYSTVPLKGLSTVLRLEADRMRKLKVSKTLLHREREVVKEERQMRVTDNPNGVLTEYLNGTAFMSSPYHHPVIGWPQDVASYTVSDLQSWYNKWYQPNNATLVLVGDVDLKTIKKQVTKYFAKIPASKAVHHQQRPEVSFLGKKRFLIHYRANVALLNMGYLVPGLSQASPSWKAYALCVLAEVLGGSESSRLDKVLVRERRIATTATVSYYPMHRYKTLFTIGATPSHLHSLGEVEQAINAAVEDLQEDVIDKSELRKAQAQLIARHVYEQDSLANQAMQVGLPVMGGLSWQAGDWFKKRIQSVTVEQVRWAAQHYLNKNHLTVGYLEPSYKKA